MSKLISIGMCCYNSEKTILRAIESVLNQTYGNFELLIIDAKSTDSTRIIANKFASQDNRIKILKREKQYSWYSNAIFALNSSSGELFTWLDPDDYINTNYLETLITNLTQNYVAAMGTVVMIDDSNKAIIDHAASLNKFKFYESKFQIKRKSFAIMSPENLGWMNSLYALYETKFLLNHITWNANSDDPLEDVKFAITVLGAGRIRNCGPEAIIYRNCKVHSNNYIFEECDAFTKFQISNNLRKKILNFTRVYPPKDTYRAQFKNENFIFKVLVFLIINLRLSIYSFYRILRLLFR